MKRINTVLPLCAVCGKEGSDCDINTELVSGCALEEWLS